MPNFILTFVNRLSMYSLKQMCVIRIEKNYIFYFFVYITNFDLSIALFHFKKICIIFPFLLSPRSLLLDS